MTIRISAFEAHAASNGEQEAVSRQGGGSGGGGKSQGLVERRPDEDARQILNVLESWEAVQRRVGGVLKCVYLSLSLSLCVCVCVCVCWCCGEHSRS